MFRFVLIITIIFAMLSVSAFGEEVSYWTCSMHPTVKADKPGKCPICGMDLIPVYKEKEEKYYGCGVTEEGHCPHCDEGNPDAECICGGHSFVTEEKQVNCPVCNKPLKELTPEEAKTLIEKNIVSRVKLSQQQIVLGGIRTETVEKRRLTKEIKTVGKVAYDPELLVAQEEFINALVTREKVKDSTDIDVINRSDDIINKSKIRLRLLGMSEEEISQLEKERNTQKSLILPEDMMWIYADVYEYELGWVTVGEKARVTAAAFPGEEFGGIIKSISPVLDPKTRSARVRIDVVNPQKKLQPEMYVDVVIESMYKAPDGSHEVTAVPVEAVLDTGARKIVYIDTGDGKYIGKEIKTGPAAVDSKNIKYYPVLDGLSEGDKLVTKGNFLIDSQSQLTGGMSVLWGGAAEIKEEKTPADGETPVKTEHRH